MSAARGRESPISDRVEAKELLAGLIDEADTDVAVGKAIDRVASRFRPEHPQAWEALRWAAEELARPKLGRDAKAVVWPIVGRYMGRTAESPPLALVDEDAAGPDLAELAFAQTEGARALLSRDLSGAPRWPWPDLDGLTGPMLPGDVVPVGALPGNGKSTFLESAADGFARAGVATLYVPSEVDPETCRYRWAAGRLGLETKHAVRQDWHKLPDGSREAIEAGLEDLALDPCIHFAPEKRPTIAELRGWCERARHEAGCTVVMLDHLHRLSVGGDEKGYRVSFTDAMRALKDMARELGIVLIAAAHLNRSSDPIDAYVAPHIARFKETSAIAEEADVVLMLSRRLKADLPDQWNAKLRAGTLQEWQLAEPQTMVVTCRKHRLDDSAKDRRVLLSVRSGRVESRAPDWRTG